LHDAVRERPEEVDAELARRVRGLLELSGEERVLAVGEGLAPVLAPNAREVVEVAVEQLTALPFERGSFDLTITLGSLHHVRRPELAVAELARVTRFGGRILVADQLAPIDPLQAVELDRVERERDPTHTRLLPDTDLRGLFDANGLVLLRSEVDAGTGWYLLRR
jgi:SAM-dependent methyltransferase